MIKIWHNHLVVKVINNIVQKLQALLGLMVIWSGSIITSRRLSFCMYLWTLHRGLDITLVTLGFRSQEKIHLSRWVRSLSLLTCTLLYSVITCTSAIHYDYSRVLSDSVVYLWLCTLVCGVKDLHQAFIWSTGVSHSDFKIHTSTIIYLDVLLFFIFGYCDKLEFFWSVWIQ